MDHLLEIHKLRDGLEHETYRQTHLLWLVYVNQQQQLCDLLTAEHL